MNEKVYELLHHFYGKSFINCFYITNITDNIEDKYNLDELLNYKYYKVVNWGFNVCENKMLITIER